LNLRRLTVTAALLLLHCLPVSATTWFIRADGGTRYSAKALTGQCNGRFDAAYPGKGTNKNCAFNDLRYMWDDQSYNSGSWVMVGGDTVIIQGCAAARTQQEPDAPACRIGWDAQTGPGAGYTWCLGGGPYNQSSYGCYNPPIPPGSPSQHTRILGANYKNCSENGSPNRSAMARIFGGWSLLNVLSLADTKYVDIECIDIGSHNGKCTVHGTPAYPRYCSTSYPLDDYDSNGILVNNKSSNILLQDVAVHGHTNSGILGPIGGPFTLRGVFIGFNTMAGWNFDDGHNTPNAAGSTITAEFVTMEGNGCTEEWPIVHPGFPAKACYDDVSAGFGDSWSGQDSTLASFTCNRCVQMYNTKDGFIGPHTQITNLSIINSKSIGNMGQQWKWNNTPHATTVFEDNITVGNCARMSQPLPGAGQSFAKSSGLPGAYLTDFCRAAGDTFSFSSQANSHVLLAGNTIVSTSATIFDINCGPAGGNAGTCGSTPFVFTDNLVLGYTYPGSNSEAPALYYRSDHSVVITAGNNLEFGVRNGGSCGRSIVCSDPMLRGEPPRRWSGEAALDSLDFTPLPGSPAIGAGVGAPGLSADYFEHPRPARPTIGAIEPGAAHSPGSTH
jgi:hypothetical protein